MTAWKTGALTVFRLWHLVRENAICIRHKSNLFPADWCLCVRVCVPDCVCPCLSACGCVLVCVYMRHKEKRESLWDLSALGWHTVRRTHFITGLFTWLTGLLYQLHNTPRRTAISNTLAPQKPPPRPILYRHKRRPAQSLQTHSPTCRLTVFRMQNGVRAQEFPPLGRVSGRHQIHLPADLN